METSMSNPNDDSAPEFDQEEPVTITLSPEISSLLRERVDLLGIEIEDYDEEALESSLGMEVTTEVECVVFQTEEAAEYARDKAAELDDMPEFKNRKIVPYENEGQTGFVVEIEEIEEEE